MKFDSSKIVLILLILIIAVNFSFEKKGKLSSKYKNKKSHKGHSKQVNYISDRSNFGSDIGVVIRKSPSVFTDNRLGEPLLEPPQQFVSFGNSNTSNLPNVGTYPKSAEIVNPTILFHSNMPAQIVKSQPAHLGYRNEKTSIASFNKRTGKVEKHEINQKKPIYGDIQSVHTVHIDSTKPYDLQFRRFRKDRNIVRENGEFHFNRNQRFINE